MNPPHMNQETSETSQPRCWVVIPAAGSGSRMSADRPKQYLPLANKTVLEHSLERLLNHDDIVGGVVAIAADDAYWATLHFQHSKPLWTAPGGEERCASVLNALSVLAEHAAADDWVLVHDAARPCVRQEDISQLVRSCRDHPVGGLLAVPVKDTIKQATSQEVGGTTHVETTVDRSLLWHAQTPQMFRLQALQQALSSAMAAGVAVTDESSAMEWAGHTPLLVKGHADNLKITHPEDIDLATFFLFSY